MIYTIKRIKNKRVIFISLSLIIILTSSILSTSFFIEYFNKVIIVSGILISLPLSLILGILLSQKVLVIKFDNDIIEFEDRKIPLSEINGFYINEKSPIMTQIELRTISNDIELTAYNFGKSGQIFKSFISELLEKAANTNSNFIELSYYDFHPSQGKFAKVFLIIMIVLAVVINLAYVYLVLYKGMKSTWKIFLFNLMLMAVYANHQKDKKSQQVK